MHISSNLLFVESARRALSALALARDGLSERELTLALRMPPSHWAPVRNAVLPYLVGNVDDSDAALRFFHPSMRAAVCARYRLPLVEAFVESSSSSSESGGMRGGQRYGAPTLGYGDASGDTAIDVAALHLSIARMFADRLRHGARLSASTQRAVRELPYHLLGAGRVELVCQLLGDVTFVSRKCSAGAAADLLDDYTRTRAALRKRGLGGSSTSRSTLMRRSKPSAADDPARAMREMSTWLRSVLHIVVNEPTLTFQLAANAPRGSAPHTAAARLWSLVGDADGATQDDDAADADFDEDAIVALDDTIESDASAALTLEALLPPPSARDAGVWLRWLNAPQ